MSEQGTINKESIHSTISKYRPQIVNLGVKKLGLFGSMVRGEMRPDSDIDFLVEFEKGKKNFDNFMELSFFLENIFNHKIDLVTEEALSENLKTYIYKEVDFIEIQ